MPIYKGNTALSRVIQGGTEKRVYKGNQLIFDPPGVDTALFRINKNTGSGNLVIGFILSTSEIEFYDDDTNTFLMSISPGFNYDVEVINSDLVANVRADGFDSAIEEIDIASEPTPVILGIQFNRDLPIMTQLRIAELDVLTSVSITAEFDFLQVFTITSCPDLVDVTLPNEMVCFNFEVGNCNSIIELNYPRLPQGETIVAQFMQFLERLNINNSYEIANFVVASELPNLEQADVDDFLVQLDATDFVRESVTIILTGTTAPTGGANNPNILSLESKGHTVIL